MQTVNDFEKCFSPSGIIKHASKYLTGHARDFFTTLLTLTNIPKRADGTLIPRELLPLLYILEVLEHTTCITFCSPNTSDAEILVEEDFFLAKVK